MAGLPFLVDPKYGGQGIPKTVSTFFVGNAVIVKFSYLNYIANLVLALIIVYLLMLSKASKINFFQK